MSTVFERGNVSLRVSELKLVATSRTSHALVSIYRHPQLGRVLILNGEIQHVEAWAPLYHEPLIHIPMAVIRRPETALLLGGGSFYAAQELLKYKSLRRVLMIDHDAELLELVADVYEHASAVRKDARLEVKNADAFSALADLTERFDLIVNDCSDLAQGSTGIAEVLANLLTQDGVCTDVVYRHIFDQSFSQKAVEILHGRLRRIVSLIFVPEYPGILHLLTMWGRNNALRQDLRSPLNLEQLNWAETPSANPCVYYDPRFLAYHLHIPRYLRSVLALGRPT